MKPSRAILAFIAIVLVFGAIASATPSPNVTGVYWDPGTSSSPALTRVGSDNSTITAPSFDLQYPWSQMGRVNNSATQNQTMVWVPKFYYKEVESGTSHTFLIWNSTDFVSAAAAGYTVYPAFIVNTTEIPGFYIGAFEGDQYNATYGYRNDTALTSSAAYPLNTTSDVLTSVPSVKPVSGQNITLSLTNARLLAHNRNPAGSSGWELQSFQQVSSIEWLYLVEYANFDSQATIGSGVTDITDDGQTNMAVNTGYTAGYGTNASSCGNATCQATITHYKTGQTTHPNSYRGIENFWGNVYKWVDFINIKADHNPWISSYGAASDTFAPPYTNTTLILPSSNGYVSNISISSEMNYGFLPSAVGGSATTYLTDYYYQTTGNRAALLGGYWTNGANSGAFYWILSSSASSASRYVGARAAYTPPIWANYTVSISGANASFSDTSFTISTLTGVQGIPSSWNWSFGDGAYSSSQNPTHTYTSTGTYTIVETVTDAGGVTSTYSTTQNVTVIPVASFTANATTGSAPLSVQFNDTSTNSPTSWLWVFGDGNTSTVQNATHVFNAGNWSVNLTATNAAGSNTSASQWINVTSGLNAMFTPWSASPISRWVPATIYFQDTSTGSPTSINWSFGDGITANNTANVSHQYAPTQGVYTVVETACTVDTCMTNSTIIHVMKGVDKF